MANVPETAGRQTDRRKLVAVMHADIVGYSRLIGLDDTGTLERLRALRRDVIDPAIAAHGGRIVVSFRPGPPGAEPPDALRYWVRQD